MGRTWGSETSVPPNKPPTGNGGFWLGLTIFFIGLAALSAYASSLAQTTGR